MVSTKKFETTFPISKEELLYKYSNSFIEYGYENKEIEVMKKGFSILKDIEKIYDKYFLYSLFTEIRILEREKNKDVNIILEKCKDIFNRLKIYKKTTEITEEQKFIFYSLLLTLDALYL